MCAGAHAASRLQQVQNDEGALPAGSLGRACSSRSNRRTSRCRTSRPTSSASGTIFTSFSLENGPIGQNVSSRGSAPHPSGARAPDPQNRLPGPPQSCMPPPTPSSPRTQGADRGAHFVSACLRRLKFVHRYDKIDLNIACTTILKKAISMVETSPSDIDADIDAVHEDRYTLDDRYTSDDRYFPLKRPF